MPIKIPGAGLIVATILLITLATTTQVMANQPAAPTGIAVSATDENTVNVIWTAHPDGATSYRVAWKPAGEGWKSWDNYDWNAYPSGTSYTINGLEPDTTYKVRVKARSRAAPHPGGAAPRP